MTKKEKKLLYNILFIVMGAHVLLVCFAVSTYLGFGLVIGLCVGSLVERFELNGTIIPSEEEIK